MNILNCSAVKGIRQISSGRIRQDKKGSGVQAEMSRSNMKFILMDLLDEGAITAADLDGFSDDLRDSLLTYIELRKRRENQ